jgi:hypothetical protein
MRYRFRCQAIPMTRGDTPASRRTRTSLRCGSTESQVPGAAALLRELAARRDKPRGRPSWVGTLHAGPDFAERSEDILRSELGRLA